jgi:sulfate adenylyltransferase
MPPPEDRPELKRYAASLPYVQISERTLCDLELLATGAFSPLETFLGRADYERVLEEMRLTNGTLFPIPLTLTVSKDFPIQLDKEVALRDAYNNLLALMRIEDAFPWNREREARAVCGTTDPRHPLVAEMNSWGEVCLTGALRVLELPLRHDFRQLRLTPIQVRQQLQRFGRTNVVAFQTRNPLHRAHEELTRRATEAAQGTLLLHPSVGLTKPGDIEHYTRVRSYKALVDTYDESNRPVLALLPLAMRMSGPREAVWHAIIRRNYGANFFIVGRDHASPGTDSAGRPFYEPYAAQELFATHSKEIGVKPCFFTEFLYLPEEKRFEETLRIPAGTATLTISGTEVRDKYLRQGQPLPNWFTRPEVAAILEKAYPPLHQQGFCIWFTGLSSSGKSTTANILLVKLLEHGRQVTLLDGDVVRTHLSQGLGFSKEDRDINIRRIGYVAAEIVRHGGVAICAAVSPYRHTRNQCRSMTDSNRFIEVFVNTPLAECEARDTKGIYQRARAGEIKNVTGLDDPYEPPFNPEIALDTVSHSAEENAELILTYLLERGFLPLSSDLQSTAAAGMPNADC